MLLVKRVKKTNIYDVFLGMGWRNHTRLLINNNGFVQHLKGTHLTTEQTKQFKTIVGA